MYDKFVRMKFGMRKISLIKYSDIREFYNYLINDLSFKPNKPGDYPFIAASDIYTGGERWLYSL